MMLLCVRRLSKRSGLVRRNCGGDPAIRAPPVEDAAARCPVGRDYRTGVVRFTTDNSQSSPDTDYWFIIVYSVLFILLTS